VAAPIMKEVNVTASIDVEEGYTFENVKSQVAAKLLGYFNGELLGKDILVAKLGSIIYGIDGVKNYSITTPAADIEVADNELATLGTVAVNAWS